MVGIKGNARELFSLLTSLALDASVTHEKKATTGKQGGKNEIFTRIWKHFVYEKQLKKKHTFWIFLVLF